MRTCLQVVVAIVLAGAALWARATPWGGARSLDQIDPARFRQEDDDGE